MKRTTLLLVLLVPVALSGCHTIRSHNPFHHKPPPYKSAKQEPPLEVPPGMNQPPTNQALAIPQAGGGQTPASQTAAPQNAAPPPAQLGNPAANPANPAAAPQTEAPPPAQASNAEVGPAGSTAGATGATLDLSDTPASVYHRVGLALARAEVGKVTAHNDAARTYEVAVNTTATQKPGGGFFHRLFHHSKTQTVSGTVAVEITGKGTHSVVSATGNPAAVSRVMAMLRERLK
jgi:uncharacterized lipoprotein